MLLWFHFDLREHNQARLATGFHLVSLVFSWLQLVSFDLLGFIWFHVVSLVVVLIVSTYFFTWFHVVSLDFHSFCLASFGVIWFHLISLGFSGFHSLGSEGKGPYSGALRLSGKCLYPESSDFNRQQNCQHTYAQHATIFLLVRAA